MRTTHRIVVGLLVGLFFAAGYGVRSTLVARERAAIVEPRLAPAVSPGTRVASVGLAGAADIDFRPIETLYSVLTSLRQHYVEQLTDKEQGEMTYDALRAMLASLNDPDTRFVEADEAKVIADAREGKFHGIGVMLGIRRIKTGLEPAKSDTVTEEHLVIVAPILGGPAAEAGLKPGDDITAVNGKIVLPFDPFQRLNMVVKEGLRLRTDRTELRKQVESEQKRLEGGMSIAEAQKLLTTEDKKPVELTLSRKGAAKPIKVKIEPGEFTVEPVTSKIIEGGRFGYVRINCFTRDAGERLGEAIREFKSRGVKGMALDLRDVTGGEVDSMLRVARYLVSKRSVGVLLKARNKKSTLEVAPGANGDAWNDLLVALVDRGTARTPELLASALKDGGAAKLVGEKTYGDSVYTTFIQQRDGSGILMTTGMFLTSKGRDYTGKGISVDVQAAASGSGDNQLNEAVKALASGGDRN